MKYLLLVSLFLSSTAFAGASLNDRHSQDELSKMFAKSARCPLVGETGKSASTINLIKGKDYFGNVAYFAEVITSGKRTYLHIQLVGLVRGGYRVSGKTGFAGRGPSIEGILLDKESRTDLIDVNIDLKENMFADAYRFIGMCN